MWSHYAENHIGYCIKYDTQKSPLFDHAFPVIYEAIAAGKHNGFYALQEKLGQSIGVVRNDVVSEVSAKAREEFIIRENAISVLLTEI